MKIYTLFVLFFLFSCGGGEHECDLKGDKELQQDDSGIFTCSTEPAHILRKETRVRSYKNTRCDLNNYTLTIEDNIIRCSNESGDLYLGTASHQLNCFNKNIGTWISVTLPEIEEIFYFKCDTNFYTSRLTLKQLLDNGETSEIYQTCSEGQKGVMSEDRTSFSCESIQ